MTKITKDDLDKVVLIGTQYEAQELRDMVTQLELEKQDEDGGDVIIFRGKQYSVKKATYDVIRKTKQTLIFRRYAKSLYERILEMDGKKEQKASFAWLRYVPLLFTIFDAVDNWRYKRSWIKLCELTFGDKAKDFALGNLTTGEVQRIMRIFFRFQAELFPAVQDAPRKNSPVT